MPISRHLPFYIKKIQNLDWIWKKKKPFNIENKTKKPIDSIYKPNGQKSNIKNQMTVKYGSNIWKKKLTPTWACE